jgi:rhodanese-related sulfurtransferase
LKNTVYYEYADSLKVLEAVQSKPGRPVVLFNMVNNGAAELADWLAGKGISNVSFLVGNVNLLYEYALNKNKKEELNLFRSQSSIRFYTPETFCTGGNGQWIDIRHDSLFNKVNKGVKHEYRHLKNALNFYSGKSALEFEKTFPDKSKTYVFINSSGGTGIDLANSLASAGYGIIWLIGGYDRWEWYMNNVEGFKCNDRLE